jgi:hypothetical protein
LKILKILSEQKWSVLKKFDQAFPPIIMGPDIGVGESMKNVPLQRQALKRQPPSNIRPHFSLLVSSRKEENIKGRWS